MNGSAIRRGLWLCALATVGSACTAGSEAKPGDFVSDNPAGNGGGDSGQNGGTEGGTDPSGGDGEGGDDGGREVSEADIVFIEDDRLYALSAYGGLSVIDAAAPDTALPVLGRHTMPGQPFEMYVEGAQAFVMLSDYGSYAWDEAASAYSWHSSSRLVALDASDPANIVSRGEFEVPGYIQDSRRVGDVLYLVTFEDGWCWGCADNQPRTVVTSLDVSDPAAVQQIDQIVFANETGDPWDWSGPRSVSSTDERLYVGGIEYDNWEDAHSVIDVIDISDAGGVMARGASVTVTGSIESRWQMDEHEGVLRVISQPWSWNLDNPPVVETFTVTSAADVAPLGSLAMTLPRPEELQSVRFDGERAYAITFERTDPLFTLDLSDPAAPLQVGELEIPGWVYHMEPRGDRIVALGFDQTNPEGSINVSLFDVSDFANPTMLSRVSFGGDWASFAEDQNRIHKAFTVLDDLGLLLVPYSGWENGSDSGEWNCGSYSSGIQLVDWTDDALVLRGAAPSHGSARRALMHHDRLLAMSDKSVQSFDIGDRDAPQPRAEVALAVNVADVAFGDGIVVRLATDWWSGESALEVVGADEPDAAEPLGRMSLDAIDPAYGCGRTWTRELFVHGGHAYLLRQVYGWDDYDDETTFHQSLVLDAIDVRDPSAPQWVSTLELPFSLDGSGGSGLNLQSRERQVVLAGDSLVFATSKSKYDGERYVGEDAQLELVDLREPGQPTHAASLARPGALAHGGLLDTGLAVISWHMKPVAGDDTKVRFYFDQFDVTDAASPDAAPPVNVPGQPVAFDGAEDRLVTVGFQLSVVDAPEGGCWSLPRVWSSGGDGGSCTIASRPLHLLRLQDGGATLLDTLDVEGDEGRLVAVEGHSPIFALVRSGNDGWGWGWDDGGGYGGDPTAPADSIAIVTGMSGTALTEASRVTLERSSWTSLLGSAGASVAYRSQVGIGVIDATDPAAPEVTTTSTAGYGCYAGVVTDDAVYCPMGEYGLQTVPMP